MYMVQGAPWPDDPKPQSLNYAIKLVLWYIPHPHILSKQPEKI